MINATQSKARFTHTERGLFWICAAIFVLLLFATGHRNDPPPQIDLEKCTIDRNAEWVKRMHLDIKLGSSTEAEAFIQSAERWCRDPKNNFGSSGYFALNDMYELLEYHKTQK